ncbi:t-SNARE [Pseudocohnilembus persalinus]|uniref:t-SNARE n=1 Tax=Pseudocohnilembus persalinus TaxID=266149 RepID=A0A0V0QVK7_PSEPJ|nr:t-SNARE [Pseudocohnilembus persalinus]|eukprot:KRX06380.1 t-SNARE [Pseudocohnilembus persalinus]
MNRISISTNNTDYTQIGNMTDVFESYEQEFQKYTNVSQKKLDSFQSYSNDKKEQIIQEIQYDLSQADFSLKSMKTEISTQPPSVRQSGTQKIKKYQQDLDQLKKKLMKQEEEILNQKNKEYLMGAKNIELSEMSEKDKNNLLQTGTILSDGTAKLRGALRTGHETLDMADNIQSNLYEQNLVLDRNIERNREMRGDLSHANNLITSMKRRIMRNKMTLYGVLAFLLLVVFLIIYFNYFSGSSDNNDNSSKSNNNNYDQQNLDVSTTQENINSKKFLGGSHAELGVNFIQGLKLW